jgi:hypothetical protein
MINRQWGRCVVAEYFGNRIRKGRNEMKRNVRDLE